MDDKRRAAVCSIIRQEWALADRAAYADAHAKARERAAAHVHTQKKPGGSEVVDRGAELQAVQERALERIRRMKEAMKLSSHS